MICAETLYLPTLHFYTQLCRGLFQKVPQRIDDAIGARLIERHALVWTQRQHAAAGTLARLDAQRRRL